MSVPIEFRFHPEKAVEAAAMFLNLHKKKPMKYIGLLKMLYIADRIALDRMEKPITGDRSFSLDFGPVLSSVYDLIKGQKVGNALPLWSKYIATSENSVTLLADPSKNHLCQEEEEIIEQVYNKLGHIDPFTVAEWTHDLPEWQNPHGSCIPIVVDDVLRYMHKTDEDITVIRQEAYRDAYLDRVLSA
jgi:uncharacterized phage-associated protein